MFEIIDIQVMNHVSLRLVSLLAMTYIKGFFLFAVIYFVLQRMKRLTAEFRHFMWFFVICSFVILPFSSVIVPSIDLHLVKVPVEMEEVHRVFDSRLSSQFNYGAQAGVTVGVASGVKAGVMTGVTEGKALQGLQWTSVVLMVWVFGVMVSLVRIVVGKVGLLCVTRKAVLSKEEGCVLMVEGLREEMGIRRMIEVRESCKCLTPFTCNVFRPVILLPATALLSATGASVPGWGDTERHSNS